MSMKIPSMILDKPATSSSHHQHHKLSSLDHQHQHHHPHLVKNNPVMVISSDRLERTSSSLDHHHYHHHHLRPKNKSIMVISPAKLERTGSTLGNKPSLLHQIYEHAKFFTAGSFAGVCECLVGHPLDTLKVRMQTGGGGNSSNIIHIIGSTIKHEGFLALYRGASSRVVGSAVANSVLFGTNGEFKRLFQADSSNPVSAPFLLAAGCTGAVEALVYTPVDLVKTRCQVQYGREAKLTPWTVTKQLVKEHGVFKGLFAGIGPTLLREILGNMAYFGVYETAKRAIMHKRQMEEGDTLTFIMAGGTAGMSYWALTYPIDTIKSIVQSQEIKLHHHTNAWRLAAEVYRTKGIYSFYCGLSPALLRAFPACATTFTSYEWALKVLDSI